MKGVRHYPGFLAVTILCLTILYVPLIVVAIYSFNASTSITSWGGFSFRWYADVFTGPEAERFGLATRNSLMIAFIAATVATAYSAVAIPASLWVMHDKRLPSA